MIPTLNSSYVTEAKARLLSMYKGRPIVEGMLTAYVKQIQRIENALWDIILNRNLETTNSACLDGIGTILQEERKGRTNDEYRAALRIRQLVLRSQGKRHQLSQIISLSAAGSTWRYWDAYPAGFFVYFAGTLQAFKALAKGLRDAKAAGVEGQLSWYTTPSDLFVWGDSTGGTTSPLTARGFASTDGLPLAVYAHVDALEYP